MSLPPRSSKRPGRSSLRWPARPTGLVLVLAVISVTVPATALGVDAQGQPSSSLAAPSQASPSQPPSAGPPASASPMPAASSLPDAETLRPEGSWVATAYDTWGDGLVAPLPGSTLTLSLLPAGRLEGRTGCGSYFGGHIVEGQSIRLGILSSESDCGRRRADEAFGFTQALAMVSRWAKGETGLDLLDDEGRIRAILERPGAATPVGDWLVSRYARPSGGLTEAEAGLQAGLRLAEDGSATGSTGCRGLEGAYSVEADRIVIAPLTVVGLPCEGSAQRQDRRLRALLDDAVGWQRSTDTLLLRDAEGAILLELRERASPDVSPDPPAPRPPDPPQGPNVSAARRSTTTALLVSLVTLAVGGRLAAALDDPGPVIALAPIASGFEEPVFVTGTGDDSGDLYVVEQAGRIWRLDTDGSVDPAPMLDISERVLHHNERGLLGLALHPDIADNGRFFVTYSQADDGATSISEFTLPRPGAPSEASERPLLVIPQVYTTHKAGMLAFDREGMLLASTGDGGSGNDPHGHGLDRWSLLGKLLRLDVDTGWPYAIPPDNGFAGDGGSRGEIHALGLRNPWRFSVDRLTGAVYIGDVGQSAWEEIDVLPEGSRGASFGWSEMEGPGCRGGVACDPGDHLPPATAYPHVTGGDAHCAVVGGYAYRGGAGTLPQGTYLYGDYCSGTVWAVPVADLVAGHAEPVVAGRLDPSLGGLRSFGEDDAGELYVVASGGAVLRVVAFPG